MFVPCISFSIALFKMLLTLTTSEWLLQLLCAVLSCPDCEVSIFMILLAMILGQIRYSVLHHVYNAMEMFVDQPASICVDEIVGERTLLILKVLYFCDSVFLSLMFILPIHTHSPYPPPPISPNPNRTEGTKM